VGVGGLLVGVAVAVVVAVAVAVGMAVGVLTVGVGVAPPHAAEIASIPKRTVARAKFLRLNKGL